MINYIAYDPNTGEIVTNGIIDEQSLAATAASNPQFSFMEGLAVPGRDYVDLITMSIVHAAPVYNPPATNI